MRARRCEFSPIRSIRRIDLVVTDVVLPGGMSGADLGEVLSRTKPRLPVLFTSGYTRHLTTRAGQPVPEARLLHKPYSIEALASRCRHAIDDAGSKASAATLGRARGIFFRCVTDASMGVALTSRSS